MSTGITRVQQKLGVQQSGEWNNATAGAVLAFQQTGKGQFPMTPTGHPDPATLVNLGYYAPTDALTTPWADYLAGGDKPGHFWRDLRTSIDQVPRWAWGTVAVAFGAFGYMAYRTDRKREKTK